MKNIFFFILFCFCSKLSFAQKPLRKAFIGLLIKPVTDGVRVDSVYPNSTGVILNLKKNDVITSINNKEIKTSETFNSVVSQIRSGDKIEVKFLRGNKVSKCSSKAMMRPFEQSEIADVIYDWVAFKDGYLRAITRKPKGKTNLPCILLIPGYGCGSIETYSAGYNGRLITEWLKNGYAAVTIEKSGMGDSYHCT